MLFSLREHHLDLFVADTALKVSRSLYRFTTSISHGVKNYFPRLWGTGISDAIFNFGFWLITDSVPMTGLRKRDSDWHFQNIHSIY